MSDSNGLPPLTGAAAEQQMRRLTRRSFVVGAAATLAGLGAWRWLTTATPDDGVPWPFRRMLRFNQGLAEGLGSPHHLAPTFPAESVQGPARTNGQIGLVGAVDGADLADPDPTRGPRSRTVGPLAGHHEVTAARPGDRAEMRRGLE